MQFEDVAPAYQGFVMDRLARAGFASDSVPLSICETDEMFVRGVMPGYPGRAGAAYYRFMESSVRTFDTYSQLVDLLGGFDALDKVLDFGSGHGRLTRMLLGKMPARKIWASDIYYEAVAWQAEQYGVNGLVSVSNPARFALDQTHSIVFAASVFSHLPEGLFQRWLSRLYDLVDPKGLLAFSVHGVGFAPAGQEITDAGIGYAGWSESTTLDPSIYGMSYVTEGYVRRAIDDSCGSDAAQRTLMFRGALFESQDLYVVPGRDLHLAGLQLSSIPIGSFDKASDSATWRGWAIDLNAGADIQRIELFLGNEFYRAVIPHGRAKQVLEFFPGAPNEPLLWSAPAIAVAPDTPIRARLVSSGGREGYCYAQPIDGGLLARS